MLIPANSGWYESYCPYYPKHNNALQATNSVMKGVGTFRVALSLSDFLEIFEHKVIVPWSKERNAIFKISKYLHQHPDISHSLWIQAYELYKEKKKDHQS